MASTPFSPSVEEQMKKILEQARSEGNMAEVFKVIGSSFKAEDTTSADRQGMSDAPKRLRSTSPLPSGWENAVHIKSQGPSDAASSGYRAEHVQSPERLQTPQLPAQQFVLQPGRADAQLPPGVPSVQRWGQTLCVLPKVKSLRASYEELVTMARTSDEMRNYLEKYVMTFNGASTKVKDLRRFLEYIDFPTCIGDRPVYYAEQSTCVRRFKE